MNEIKKIIAPNNLSNKNHHRRKILGRGSSSKRGCKCGRGDNGQKARENVKSEGGNFRSYLRMKKVGFYRKKETKYEPVSIRTVAMLLEKHKLEKINKQQICEYLGIDPKLRIKILNKQQKEEQNESESEIKSKIEPDQAILYTKS